MLLNSLAWWVAHADTILGLIVCGFPLLLIVGMAWRHIVDTHDRGQWINGSHYEDATWKDD